MTTTPPLPRARGLAVAAVGVGLPTLGHLAGGGSLNLPPVTLLPLALVATLCVTASAKAWTSTRLAIALGGTGLLVHGALWAGMAHGSAEVPGATHHASGALPALATPMHAGPFLGLTLHMLLAHLVALALSVALLRHGEAFLLWLASHSQRILLPEVGLVPVPRLSTLALLSEPPAISSYIGGSGGQRAPPLLASI